MKNYKKLYEELRQAIDGGYALATHEDALESVRQNPVAYCAECGADGGHALYCVACAEKYVNKGTRMTKDETLRLALDTLKEVREETLRLMRNGERLYAEDKVWSTIITIQEALETKDRPVQVSPLEFVEIVYEKEHLIGRPIVWAQWPNAEKIT